jgi:GT2 family glycosyltransferase
MQPSHDANHAAVLIISYNGAGYLRDCINSVLKSPDAPPPSQVIVVDNASADGSADLVRRHFPQLTLIRLEENTGFAQGNNVAYEHVRRHFPHVRHVALLNQDTVVAENWLREAILTAEASPDIAAVQSKLLFHARPDHINSVGNDSHYLGFGFVGAYGQPDRGQFGQVRDVAYCCGAATLVRVSAVGRDELFDPAYFAYLEDGELGWNFRIRGLRNVYCPTSIVYHKYEFGRNPKLYYLVECNRWRLILGYYRLRTLLLIAPALAMMEVGLAAYFLKERALLQKLRSYGVFRELPRMVRQRRMVQRQRTVTDRQLTSIFISEPEFAEVQNPLLTYVGKPLLRWYWKGARLLLWW